MTMMACRSTTYTRVDAGAINESPRPLAAVANAGITGGYQLYPMMRYFAMAPSSRTKSNRSIQSSSKGP